MKPLLLSTLVLTTFGFAAMADEPMSLTDTQMDTVTAGVHPDPGRGISSAWDVAPNIASDNDLGLQKAHDSVPGYTGYGTYTADYNKNKR